MSIHLFVLPSSFSGNESFAQPEEHNVHSQQGGTGGTSDRGDGCGIASTGNRAIHYDVSAFSLKKADLSPVGRHHHDGSCMEDVVSVVLQFQPIAWLAGGDNLLATAPIVVVVAHSSDSRMEHRVRNLGSDVIHPAFRFRIKEVCTVRHEASILDRAPSVIIGGVRPKLEKVS